MYYDFQQSTTELSYQPYMYDKRDTYAYLIIGGVILIAGIICWTTGKFPNGITGGAVFGGMFIISGLYRLLIKLKTKIVFDKHNDRIYKVTALGKKKLIDFSNVYSIATWSENMSYGYELTNKKKASAKSITISSFITTKRQKKEEVRFFENTMIPTIHAFLDLENAPTINTSTSSINSGTRL